MFVDTVFSVLSPPPLSRLNPAASLELVLRSPTTYKLHALWFVSRATKGSPFLGSAQLTHSWVPVLSSIDISRHQHRQSKKPLPLPLHIWCMCWAKLSLVAEVHNGRKLHGTETYLRSYFQY